MAGSGTAHLRDGSERTLEVRELVVRYGAVEAVSNLSLDLVHGETLGVVGESGCGKSSLARALLMLPPPTAGEVRISGASLTELSGEALRRHRRDIQLIFQDARSSLNPRRRVRDLVAEGLDIWGAPPDGRQARVDQALRSVGLDPGAVRDRRPGELSGGQCQRISIARAIAIGPKVLVCDEPVSQLDVSVQATILNLLREVRRAHDLSMVFIAHDLAVVKNISDRIVVMYAGRICEVGPSDDLHARPQHPYTQLLLDSIPRRDAAAGPSGSPASVPDPTGSGTRGCRFRDRCVRARHRCAVEEPVLRRLGPDHAVACHFPAENLSHSTYAETQRSSSA